MSRSLPEPNSSAGLAPQRRRPGLRLPWSREKPSHQLFVQPGRAWHWAPGAAQPAAYEDVQSWCREHPRSEATFVLSGEMTHTLLVGDKTLPIRSDSDLRAYAEHQFAHYHGDAARRWPLALWDWGKARGVVALHGLDLEGLTNAASTHRVRVRGIEPFWSIGLRSTPGLVEGETANDAVLAIVEGSLVTLIDVQAGGAPRALWQRRLDAPTPAALDALLDEVCSEMRNDMRNEAHDQRKQAPALRVCGYGLEPGPLSTLDALMFGVLARDLPGPVESAS